MNAIYIGTYTNGGSEGIYRLELDLESGELKNTGVAAKLTNPSFLALHPSGQAVYSVTEEGEGMVAALSVGKDGALTLMNQQSSGGGGPCHVSVSPAGDELAVANYGGGSVSFFPLNPAPSFSLQASDHFAQHTGSSVDPKRQEGPHAHCVIYGEAGKFALVADLGLDQVVAYSRPGNAAPKMTALPAGAGPRHLAQHPNGRWVYVVNELNSTVSCFTYDSATGDLASFQHISTLPEGYAEKNFPAEIRVHPSGEFVYASNRGHDSIVTYAVDAASGKLQLSGHTPTGGKTPRNFAVSPDGRYLLAANQNSDNVVLFRVPEASGVPEATGQEVQISKPVCVLFVP